MPSEMWTLLNDVRKFIEVEYADPNVAPDGEWLASEARHIHNKVCTALANFDKASERALAERAGGVKADELRRYIDRCREMSNDGEYSWWSRLAVILSTITTEPAAPEGRQEAVACPKVKYDGTGVDAIRNTPAAFIERAALGELRKSKTAMTVVCSGLLNQPFGDKVPLYTRPAEQAVTEAMVEAAIAAMFHGHGWFPPPYAMRAALKAAMEAGR